MEQTGNEVPGAVGRGVRGPAWLNRILLKVIGPASVGTPAPGGARNESPATRPAAGGPGAADR